jgi:hypothetical protein
MRRRALVTTMKKPMRETFDRQTGGYGYIVEAEKINRLANKYDYAAKVTKMVRYRESAPAEDVSVLALPLSEHWGVTADEAASNAMKEADEVIAALNAGRQPTRGDDPVKE